MNEQNKKRIAIIIAAAILILTNVCTFFLTENGYFSLSNKTVITNDDPNVLKAVSKINGLEKVIQTQYYKDVDSAVLMDGALKGMFDAIGDQYSAYYTEEEFKDQIESSTGSFEGIGILVTETEDEDTLVVTPYKGTPAANAGIQGGDIVIKVDNEDVTGKGVDYVVSKMRGEKGTTVTVTVKRMDEELSFTMQRDTIQTPSVESKVLENNIGYIAISQFLESTGEDFKKNLDELEKQNITSLIIDLRFNGGGLVDQAVVVADRLLGEGLVVYTVEKNGNKTDYNSTGEQTFNKPMVVLVNSSTASSSEILAGAIQDRQAGTLVGDKTFGKGIVQAVQPLPDKTGYRLTIAEYFTPNGRNIHKKGLTPDVSVAQPEAYQNSIDIPESEDNQLHKAIELLNSGN